jgi:hypothetical protein
VSRVLLSTSDAAARVADETLKLGGNAVDAALAGWLELAAITPWALLAPATFGVSGMGAGVRFVDGLARTPGRDLVRPVRYASLESAPAIARLAVPTSVAAFAVSVALGASFTLSKLGSAAVLSAKRVGATHRAKLLSRVGGAGFLALREGSFHTELERVAPRIEGRVLTERDFDDVVPEVSSITADIDDSLGQLHIPGWWSAPDESTSDVFHLLVVDRWGTLASASWSRPALTVGLFEDEVQLPLVGTPLVKGVPKPTVGARIGAPHAVGMLATEPALFGLAATTGQIAHLSTAADRLSKTSFAESAATDSREEILVVGAPRSGEPYSKRLPL